ncbi:MAG: DUF2807 domain-containing protein [Alistipes sp.]|nr:DUF2807 domain-containing protein [Alistipes sp.]
MKNTFFIISALTLIIGTAGCVATKASNTDNLPLNNKNNIVIKSSNAHNAASRLVGSGNIISKSEKISNNYTTIKASRGVKVEMSEAGGDTATIKADDNVMPHVIFEVSGGVLNVSISNKEYSSISNCTVIATIPANDNITAINASSAAEVTIRPALTNSKLDINTSSAAKVVMTGVLKIGEMDIDTSSSASIQIVKAEVKELDASTSSAGKISGAFNADNCELEASSAASINMELLAVECSADASSAGNITLSGECATMEAEASSGASINGKKFCAHKHADATASSGGDVKIKVAKSLKATASSGGDVRYFPVNGSISLVSRGDVKQGTF